MNRYTVTKQLGDGTYGSVLKAVNRQTGEVVSVRDYDVTSVSYDLLSVVTISDVR